MAGIAEAAGEMPDIHGRTRGIRPRTPSATVLHAAAQLAAELAAAALVISTETGGAPRACAEYRTNRPITALSHNPVLRNQLMLQWGAYPMRMPTTASVELVEASVVATRDFGGTQRRTRRAHLGGARRAFPERRASSLSARSTESRRLWTIAPDGNGDEHRGRCRRGRHRRSMRRVHGPQSTSG
jgi:pyruvate kinase-like protein